MKNSVTKEDVDLILSKTLIKVEKFGDKTTVLMATLPNGFTIIESSSCVDPINFDMAVGEQICMQKLEDKIWELEGYNLQSELYKRQDSAKPWFNRVDIEQRANEMQLVFRRVKEEEII